MHAGYEDIIDATDGKVPLWWDQNGVPRFRAHHPDLAPDIYAEEVLLLRVACQRCLHEQLVQMTWGHNDAIQRRIGEEWLALRQGIAIDSDKAVRTLADSVRDGTLHYGDPPYHDDDRGEFCHAGCTMGVWDLRVEEFWAHEGSGWKREPALEVLLPNGQAKEEGRLDE